MNFLLCGKNFPLPRAFTKKPFEKIKPMYDGGINKPFYLIEVSMFLKYIPVAALAAWCTIGNANEIARSDKSKAQQDPCACEVPCEPKAPCVWKFNPCPPKCCTPNYGLYAVADFLYWRAENHGFNFAYNRTGLTTNSNSSGSLVRPNASWEPAFRVGLGWNTEYDFWDLLLNWTWYHNTSNGSATAVAGFAGAQGVLAPGTGTPFGSASATYKLKHNSIDLEVGRMMAWTKTISVRPFWGVRGAWINQKLNASYLGSLSPETISTQTMKWKNKWWGVGPRIGANGDWELGCGFSMLSKMAGAMLYGQSRVRNYSEFTSQTVTTNTQLRSIAEHNYQLVPTLQMLVGLQWGTCFRCDSMYFHINANWETNYYWDQFNIPILYAAAATDATTPITTFGSQPLTMEGLTINMELDF
ncbi:MAG: hypothetical protein A3E80_06620 [Chlamydiae bacterium RIFCSPHIGHO2_12_FULL_49_9]|nr:MAG: hypothetical protein A3E80_06620 [Chlamydiae bacterium RIFCSPHIGHO2_12_FULL_49_9]